MKVDELLEARRVIKNVNDPRMAVDVEWLAEQLEKHCSDFVGAYRKTYPKFIYRGVSTTYERKAEAELAQWITIRKNRRPVQMPNWKHEILEKAFLEVGLKATRSNSIFCTTSKEIANDWGSANIIFVRDGWTGTVFENKKEGYTFQTLAGAAGAYNRAGAVEYVKQAILDLEPISFSTQAELVKVINEGYEDILITGRSYVAIPIEWLQRARLLMALKIAPTPKGGPKSVKKPD